MKKLPVLVLNGFSGAEKTLLNHILHNEARLKVVVVINNMSKS